MDPFSLLELISLIFFFILVIVFFWRASKLKPPYMFFLLDFVCYRPPFSEPDPTKVFEDKPEFYTSPNEVENVVFEMVDELLKKMKAKVQDIGVLVCVVNGSSTASLSSLIVKRHKLNEGIASYDLNGKGCDSGHMAIIHAKQLLQVNHDCYALVVNTEELPDSHHVSTIQTDSFPLEYRPSGTAILLSNRMSDSLSSKFKLMGTHNIHVTLSDTPSSSDPGTSNVHVTITNDFTLASEKVLRSNVAFVYSLLPTFRVPKWFSLCHASGAPMVEAVERELKNARDNAEASRMALSWFGYESVSSLWYRLAYMEANGRRFDKGNLVSQMALWSDWTDFRGSTLVWQAIGDVDCREKKTKPMLFKLFGDINYRQFLPKF